MTVLNELLNQESMKGSTSILIHCLRALVVLTPLIPLIPGEGIVRDFVEYALASVRSVTQVYEGRKEKTERRSSVMAVCTDLYIAVSRIALTEKLVAGVVATKKEEKGVEFVPKKLQRKWMQLRDATPRVPIVEKEEEEKKVAEEEEKVVEEEEKVVAGNKEDKEGANPWERVNKLVDMSAETEHNLARMKQVMIRMKGDAKM